jgi:xanthine dehydrogenase accessory factor
MDDIYEAIARLRRQGEKAVLATIVSTRGSAPRKESSKMLVLANGKIIGTIGGGAIEHQAYKEALILIAGNESKLAHYELTNDDASKEGMTCGGTVDVFLEPIKPLPTLIIFGGGHISFFLARIGKMVDFHVTEDIASVTGRLGINGASYIVIVTRGHQKDEQVLQWAATTPAAYVGMIGSKRKIHVAFEFMKTKGITQEQLERVHAPIGLAIGAETPEEIAVAIMAEIIQVRHQLAEAK